MLSKEQRREAINKWKEQKPERGIYAVRSSVDAQVWVGASRNLSASRNSIWFSLRHGSHHDKRLQAEWNRHGEASFTYEVLEMLDEDVHDLAIADELSGKRKRWSADLSAHSLL